MNTDTGRTGGTGGSRSAAYWLLQGDAVQQMSRIKSGSVDLLLTDPPYNVLSSGVVAWEKDIDVVGLEREAARVLKPNGAFATFASWQLWFSMLQTFKHFQFYYEVIVKRSNYFAGPYRRRPVNAHEYFLVFYKDRKGLYFDERAIGTYGDPYSRGRSFASGVNRSHGLSAGAEEHVHANTDGFRKPISVMEMRAKNHFRHEERTEHPTQKDAEFVARWVKALCPEGGVVLDPFMGSGTTGVSALSAGRRFIGVELSPEYYAVAQARISSAGAEAVGA